MAIDINDALEVVAMADLAIAQCDQRLQVLELALESYQTRRALYVEKRAQSQLWLDSVLVNFEDIQHGTPIQETM